MHDVSWQYSSLRSQKAVDYSLALIVLEQDERYR